MHSLATLWGDARWRRTLVTMPNNETHDFAWNDIYSGEVSDLEEPDSDILSIVSPLTPGRALEVGCGAGGLALALAKRGWEVVGVDLAENAIAAARKVFAANGAEGEFHAADAASFEPTGRFDLVTTSFALPDTQASQDAVFRLIRKVLVPGGTVVIKDFDASMTRFAEFARFHCPALEELQHAFEGFEVVRAEVVATPTHGHGEEDTAVSDWTAALFHGRRSA